eukprot:6259652-Amphidinium_carterae.1
MPGYKLASQIGFRFPQFVFALDVHFGRQGNSANKINSHVLHLLVQIPTKLEQLMQHASPEVAFAEKL